MDGILYVRHAYKGETIKSAIVVPNALVKEVLQQGHGTLFSGHEGQLKTRYRITQQYWWPKLEEDIAEFLKSCEKCQARRKDDHPKPTLLTPLPQCTEPNQRIHADLFGGLKTSVNNKKYVLCMTDAFTKYVELVAIPKLLIF